MLKSVCISTLFLLSDLFIGGVALKNLLYLAVSLPPSSASLVVASVNGVCTLPSSRI